jgi:hypothetical protein
MVGAVFALHMVERNVSPVGEIIHRLVAQADEASCSLRVSALSSLEALSVSSQHLHSTNSPEHSMLISKSKRLLVRYVLLE